MTSFLGNNSPLVDFDQKSLASTCKPLKSRLTAPDPSQLRRHQLHSIPYSGSKFQYTPPSLSPATANTIQHRSPSRYTYTPLPSTSLSNEKPRRIPQQSPHQARRRQLTIRLLWPSNNHLLPWHIPRLPLRARSPRPALTPRPAYARRYLHRLRPLGGREHTRDF
jgi:hypothetical protein